MTDKTETNVKKLAIYGGTFAPVHNGHIEFALGYLRLEQPDKLLIMPTFIPPHKQLDKADKPECRLEMLHLAFDGLDERIAVSDFETSRVVPSYTVLTLEHFTAPDTELTFLCGSDMFLTLEEWYRAPDIFKLCRIVFALRKEGGDEYTAKINERREYYTRVYGADILELPIPVIDISSTELRRAVRAGEDIAQFVPGSVNKYIAANRLYII
jgi:nicotinate (nicotinamide) nucleotide adenylyltransferase